MLGIGTGPKGEIFVTDDDIIEKSNLSRQFLFRNHNVGMPKSECAAKAARVMCPGIKVRDMQDRVAPTTESVFNDQFWSDLDLVCNALDNIKARLYVDGRYVLCQKPLLESGTLGTKCNTQLIVPHETENYGATKDPPEKEAPQCAIHNFPHNIDHCLGLARSEFVGNFETVPSDTNGFIKGGPAFIEKMRAAGENINVLLDKLVGDKKVLSIFFEFA